MTWFPWLNDYGIMITMITLKLTKNKQIILPIAILVTGVATTLGLSSFKKAPEEKPQVDTGKPIGCSSFESTS